LLLLSAVIGWQRGGLPCGEMGEWQTIPRKHSTKRHLLWGITFGAFLFAQNAVLCDLLQHFAGLDYAQNGQTEISN
jgi:hypothetical protein